MASLGFSDLSHDAQLDRLESLARDALSEHYGFDGALLAMEAQQYEDNAVWRVTERGSDAAFMARLSVRDGRSAHQQQSEMRWLESLAASGTVAVPEPVKAGDGSFVVPVAVPGHGEASSLAVFHWVPGTADPPYQRPGTAESMGSVTAHLHENALEVSLQDFDRPVWDARTILLDGHALTSEAARRQLGDQGVATLRDIAASITPLLESGEPGDSGRIHADLHRGNMIALPDGSVGVIDFDDCGTGRFLLDIATVLSSVYRAAGGEPEAYAAFADAYLAGYSRVRPLPKGFDDLLEAHLLLRDTIILNFVTAAVPVNAAVAEWGPQRIAGILASMAEHLEGRPYPGTIRRQGAHPQ